MVWKNPIVLSNVPKEQVNDPWWRLNNLYWIADEDGDLVLFRPNKIQSYLYQNMHYRCVILKARQLGCTTFLQAVMLDQALFRPGIHCGTIAHTNDSVEDIFDNKIKFMYDHLPEDLKAEVPPDTKNAKRLGLGNGSSFRVARSIRGSTMQMLHVSEYGITCFEDAKKALEIKTGALRTVHKGNYIFIESTAKGSHGDFFDRCQTARRVTLAAEQGRAPLTSLDYKFFFFPWWEDDRYQLPGVRYDPTGTDIEYFDDLESKIDRQLSNAQKVWFVKTRDDLNEEMKSEYPSTPEEAFEKIVKGAIFGTQMHETRLDRRVTQLPHERGVPVNTFWDLGHNDVNAIWFHQRIGAWDHFIRYYEHRLVDITHYIEVLTEYEREHGYQWGTMYLPHDGKSRHIESVAGSAADILRAEGFDVRVVNRPIQKNRSEVGEQTASLE